MERIAPTMAGANTEARRRQISFDARRSARKNRIPTANHSAASTQFRDPTASRSDSEKNSKKIVMFVPGSVRMFFSL